MSLYDRIHFKMMAFMHDTLYGLFMKPYSLLEPAGVKADQIILEVGCGPGFFTIPAAKLVGEQGKVFSIDINPFAIESTKKKISKADVKNVEVKQLSIYETDFEDQSFNLAFLFGIIHSLDLDKTITEIHRILKPRGIMSIQKRKSLHLVQKITQSNLFELDEISRRIIRFKKKDSAESLA